MKTSVDGGKYYPYGYYKGWGWWTDRTCYCSNCGASNTLEKGDEVFVHSQTNITFRCGQCSDIRTEYKSFIDRILLR